MKLGWNRGPVALAAVMAASACIGNIGSGDSLDGATESQPLRCDDPAQTVAQPLRRLTRYEYVGTMRALLGDEAVAAADAAIAQIPSDRTGLALESLSQEVSPAHVRGYFAAAEALANYFVEDGAARGALAPCLESTLDAACIETMLREFGARAYRRALTEEEVAQLLALHATGSDDTSAFRMALSALLLAPPVLFKLELEGEERDGVLRLAPDELANRLAYYLWGAPPDEALRAAAQSGALDTDESLAAEADRMLADPRARAHMHHFLTQWLLLDQDFDVENVPPYLTEGLDLVGVNDAARAELVDLVDGLVWDEGAGLAQLMTTTDGIPSHPALAAIYGVKATGDRVELGPERAGILTRLFLLGDMAGVPHPIHRGVRIRRQLLCGELSLPDPNDLPPDATEDPPLDPNASTRERFDAKVGAAECAGCHQLINPLGNALGRYDGLGRFVAEELVYDTDGTLLGTVPIDAQVDPMLDGTAGDMVDGAVELGQRIAASSTAQRCVARQWFWHSIGRKDDPADRCAIDALEHPLTAEGLRAMMRAYVTAPQFRTKPLAEGSKP